MNAARKTTGTDRRVAEASDSIASLLLEQERSSTAIMDLVGSRLQVLERTAKELHKLTALLRAEGEVPRETDVILRKLHSDIGANLRMTASIRVALQRSPSLKHYHLIAE